MDLGGDLTRRWIGSSSRNPDALGLSRVDVNGDVWLVSCWLLSPSGVDMAGNVWLVKHLGLGLWCGGGVRGGRHPTKGCRMPVHFSGSEILEVMSENLSYIQHKIGETARPDGKISSGACQPN